MHFMRRRTCPQSNQASKTNTLLATPKNRQSPKVSFPGLLVFIIISLFLVYWLERKQQRQSAYLSSRTIISDDEDVISAWRLQLEDSIPPSFNEQVLACMPTITRKGAEYVSNAVKSWRIATNGSTVMRRLVVFDMDVHSSGEPQGNQRPTWLDRVFDKKDDIPTWLMLANRESTPQQARKHTLGDSEARVAWRSKEAQDYAEVLRRCADMTTGRYVLILQDDVLFTSAFHNAVQWADTTLRQREYKDEQGRTRIQRICSGSLFDMAPEDIKQKDGHVLESSNMVARIWPLDIVPRIFNYIATNFDEKPVDWLVDEMCRRSRRVTLVMEPNVVRHRGAISSFSGNKRESMLTWLMAGEKKYLTYISLWENASGSKQR